MPTPAFSLSYEQSPLGVLRVRPAGELDMAVSDLLSRALIDAAGRADVVELVVDLEDAVFIDSRAVAALVAGYQAAAAAQHDFRVTNGHGIVQQVLDVTGLSEVLCR